MIAPRDVSVVVQGPWNPDQTPQALASVRAHLPGAQIVLSVWKQGPDFPAHAVDADTVLLNADPGAVDLRGLLHPDIEYRTATASSNFNRQADSTLAGLRLADRPYALKLRTDMVLEHAGFLAYPELFRGIPAPMRVFGERIVTTNVRCPQRSFAMFVQDFCSFGRTEDMRLLWEAERHPSREALLAMSREERDFRVLVPEQQLVVSALRRRHEVPMPNSLANGPALAELTEQAVAGNFVCLDVQRFGVRTLKPSLDWVNSADAMRLSWLWILRASYEEYLSWCRRHCGDAVDALIAECGDGYAPAMEDAALKRRLVTAPNTLAPQPLFDEALRCCLAGRDEDALHGATTLQRAGLRDPALDRLFERLGRRPPK
jgi:hypothetical protein